MIKVSIIKRFFKNLSDPIMVGVCSNIFAAVYMLMAMYCINADVPNRALTNRALTVLLGIGIAMLVYLWSLYSASVLKRWKAEGFTLSLKLDEDVIDEEEEIKSDSGER